MNTFEIVNQIKTFIPLVMCVNMIRIWASLSLLSLVVTNDNDYIDDSNKNSSFNNSYNDSYLTKLTKITLGLLSLHTITSAMIDISNTDRGIVNRILNTGNISEQLVNKESLFTEASKISSNVLPIVILVSFLLYASVIILMYKCKIFKNNKVMVSLKPEIKEGK